MMAEQAEFEAKGLFPQVPNLSWAARLADILIVPFMYLLSGTTESPQRTHRWNQVRLRHDQVNYLLSEKMVFCKGVESSVRFHKLRFHIPILGGWRDYVVIQPEESVGGWHIGWTTADAVGVSRIVLHGPVRMLLGPGDVLFFGIRSESDNQIQILIRKIGSGRVGDRGPYRKVPLL